MTRPLRMLVELVAMVMVVRLRVAVRLFPEPVRQRDPALQAVA